MDILDGGEVGVEIVLVWSAPLTLANLIDWPRDFLKAWPRTGIGRKQGVRWGRRTLFRAGAQRGKASRVRGGALPAKAPARPTARKDRG
jgi:hypothetical protein